MKKWLLAGLVLLALTGCGNQELTKDITEPAPIVVKGEREGTGEEKEDDSSETAESRKEEAKADKPTPVKVKGVYLTAAVAGSKDIMDKIIEKIDETEINAVVIDFKDDRGRVTCRIDSPVVNEVEACKVSIQDMPGLIQKLKSHGIYTIARVVAFRDPWLAEKKPEWSLKLSDGSVFRDRKGMAWINPYKKEVWDYLIEVGNQAAECGFDEVQFDYIRFCTEKGVGNVVFDENDRQGRSKTDVVSQFTAYACKQLSDKVFVSADVFGGIISSRKDGEITGQLYGEMAKNLDYICPMIYPSHYSDEYFGIEHPDMEPYATVKAALKGSVAELKKYRTEEGRQAQVRPWLQDFTASYLKNHMEYGPEQVRAQIQAVYDAGYDEWILWSASCDYSWEGMKTEREAKEEEKQIAESRAALTKEEREAAGLEEMEGDSTEPPPELTELPGLPDYVEPAGASETEETVQVIIPQMRME